jgi:hypothetical protein
MADIDPPKSHPGWDAVGEIVRVRHTIEHPETSPYLNGRDPASNTTRVAWMVSERPGKAFPAYKSLGDAPWCQPSRTWQAGAACPVTCKVFVQATMPADSSAVVV